MNIVEAFISLTGKLLIFITGLPGCGKHNLAKNIKKDFKIKLIDQTDYRKKDYIHTIKLPDGSNIINWYTDEAIDWERLNDDIDLFQKEGLLVVGLSLPNDKIKSKPNYHIHLNISKQTCLERRKIFYEKHKDKYEEEYLNINSPIEKLKMNILIYPYYLESVTRSRVNKFININNIDDDQVYNIAFDALIDFIQNSINDINKSPSEEVQIKTPNKYIPITTESSKDCSLSIQIPNETEDEPKYMYDEELDMFDKYDETDYEKREGRIRFID